MSDAHSILSPSSAHSWVKCAGSIQMRSMYPKREDSEASMEGVAAHWVASELLARRIVAVGTIAPNGRCVTEEMTEGAELYADSFPDDAWNSLHVESAIQCPSIHAQCWGTPDAWYIRDNYIYVKDYKFGFQYVDAFENWQGISYIAGILDMHPQFNDQHMRFHFEIVQPRCFSGDGPVRSWSGLVCDLRAHINILRMAAEKAMRPDAMCVAGQHCRYCEAIHACPAAQREMNIAFDVAQMALPSPMTPAELSIVLRRVEHSMKMLKAMSDGLDEEAVALFKSGTRVPGFDIQPGRGKLAWSKGADEVVAFGMILGVDLSKSGVKTPTQATVELAKKGIDASVISEYSSHMPGALKLVQTDESAMRRVFGG